MATHVKAYTFLMECIKVTTIHWNSSCHNFVIEQMLLNPSGNSRPRNSWWAKAERVQATWAGQGSTKTNKTSTFGTWREKKGGGTVKGVGQETQRSP